MNQAFILAILCLSVFDSCCTIVNDWVTCSQCFSTGSVIKDMAANIKVISCWKMALNQHLLKPNHTLLICKWPIAYNMLYWRQNKSLNIDRIWIQKYSKINNNPISIYVMYLETNYIDVLLHGMTNSSNSFLIQLDSLIKKIIFSHLFILIENRIWMFSSSFFINIMFSNL